MSTFQIRAPARVIVPETNSAIQSSQIINLGSVDCNQSVKSSDKFKNPGNSFQHDGSEIAAGMKPAVMPVNLSAVPPLKLDSSIATSHVSNIPNGSSPLDKVESTSLGSGGSRIAVLTAWFDEHWDHPYPTHNIKLSLARQANMTLEQVTDWFTNERCRQWTAGSTGTVKTTASPSKKGASSESSRDNETAVPSPVPSPGTGSRGMSHLPPHSGVNGDATVPEVHTPVAASTSPNTKRLRSSPVVERVTQVKAAAAAILALGSSPSPTSPTSSSSPVLVSSPMEAESLLRLKRSATTMVEEGVCPPPAPVVRPIKSTDADGEGGNHPSDVRQDKKSRLSIVKRSLRLTYDSENDHSDGIHVRDHEAELAKETSGSLLSAMSIQTRHLLQEMSDSDSGIDTPERVVTSSVRTYRGPGSFRPSNLSIPPDKNENEEEEDSASTPHSSPHLTKRSGVSQDASLSPTGLYGRKRKRGGRCGRCKGCRRADCGKCKNCQDMPKFGGQGVQRQACIRRRCTHLGEQETMEPLVLAAHKSPSHSPKQNPRDKSRSLLAVRTSEAVMLGERRKRGGRCGKCSGCQRPDCGKCKNCADMPKFGGSGVQRQACVQRRCNQISDRALEVSTSLKSATPGHEADSDDDTKSKRPRVTVPSPKKRPVDGHESTSFPLALHLDGDKKSRGGRCGFCTGCLRGDCGSCKNCLDMPKFGGPGVKRQACLLRKCIQTHRPSGRSAAVDDDDVIDCLCGENVDVGFQLFCERCHTWQHADCVGIKQDEAPDTYYCPRCPAAPKKSAGSGKAADAKSELASASCSICAKVIGKASSEKCSVSTCHRVCHIKCGPKLKASAEDDYVCGWCGGQPSTDRGISEIIDVRGADSKKEYLVQWKNRAEAGEDEWLPAAVASTYTNAAVLKKLEQGVRDARKKRRQTKILMAMQV
eukprot:GFYU01002545.1.p1 GENE.GFYU01002545.1~~GFYU01002545.1.p1  ORF type:complete len:930 (-),score=185.20 GFYU01002545.1:272-3061(-)